MNLSKAADTAITRKATKCRAALVALVMYPLSLRALTACLRGPHWQRTNYRGRPVTRLGGPAYALSAAAGVLAGGGGVPAVIAAAGAAGLGAYDDLSGSGSAHGLRHHVGELGRGRVTTGTAKLVGIPGCALLAATLNRRSLGGDAVVDAVVVAGAANLANLLDLRPGRALKAIALPGVVLAAGSGSEAVVAAAAATAAVAALPADLGERTMLGDTGANTAGTLVGWAAAVRLDRRPRVLLAGTLAVLTALSEVVSFSEVIARVPWVRRLDELGRAA